MFLFSFVQTIIESSRVTCSASTPNKHNKLTVSAAPLDPRVVAAAEAGILEHDTGKQIHREEEREREKERKRGGNEENVCVFADTIANLKNYAEITLSDSSSKTYTKSKNVAYYYFDYFFSSCSGCDA